MSNHQIVFDAILGITLLVVVSKTHGLFHAPIDEEDAERISKHRWSVSRRKNQTYFRSTVDKQVTYLHRFITDAKAGSVVDHRDPNNTADHRRSNLRICTTTENARNQRARKGSSAYKGVSFHKLSSKWQAQIMVNRKQVALGLFVAEIDAAMAYDAAALEYYGEFARTNCL